MSQLAERAARPLIRTIPSHRRIRVKLRRPPFWLFATTYAVMGSALIAWLTL